LSGNLLEPDKRQAILDLLASYRASAVLDRDSLDQKLGTQFKRHLQVAKLAPWWSNAIKQNSSKIRQAESIKELLALFPVLTRSELQKNPSSFWTKPGLGRDEGYSQLSTSGSTGKPVSVYRQRGVHQIQHGAAELLDVVWQKRDLTKSTAILKIAPQNDEFENMGAPFSYLGPTGRVYRRSLSNNTISSLLDFLVSKKVGNILVNPMVLKFLISEQLRSPRPNAQFSQVMTWADQLEPELRSEAKRVFGAKLCDRYSSTEFGFLAIQCPKSEHLHALQFNNYIEILNSEGLPCEVGEPGRVVVSSLQNLAMPLIRYELGDVAAFGQPCRHGINLPVFEPRIVRTREALLLEDGSLEIPYFDDTPLTKHPDIIDYQGYRFQDGLVLIFSARTKIEPQVISETVQKLEAVFKTSKQVQILQVENLEWLGLWKRKLILEVHEQIPAEMDQDYFEKLR
jgi:phenylacetate-CoA ligase